MKERDKKGPTVGIIEQCEESRRSPIALSYKQLGRGAEFLQAQMEFDCSKATHLHNDMFKSQGFSSV